MNKDINYIRTFNPETKFVPEVINDLQSDLKKASFSDEELMEIILAVDEAVTNAILESAKSITQKNPKEKDNLLNEFSVTVSWTIDSHKFSFTVIDKGEGLDIDYIMSKTPVPGSKNFLEKLKRYEIKDNLSVRVNGNPVKIKRFGAGLKIMLSFMDKITIDYIDKAQIITDKKSNETDGTILNMIRFRKKRVKK